MADIEHCRTPWEYTNVQNMRDTGWREVWAKANEDGMYWVRGPNYACAPPHPDRVWDNLPQYSELASAKPQIPVVRETMRYVESPYAPDVPVPFS